MSEAVFAFRAGAMATLIRRDQAAERIADFLKTNVSNFPQELQDQAKDLVAAWDGETTLHWGPRRLENDEQPNPGPRIA